MKRQTSIMSSFVFILVCALPTLLLADGDPPAPPNPDQIEAARLAPWAVEQGTPQAELSPNFIKVAETPKVVPAGVAAVVNMRTIPADRGTPPDSYSWTHHQGSILQKTLQTKPVPGAPHPGQPTIPHDSSATRAAAGTYNSHFDTGSYTGWIPPDTQMAVGPEYIVEAVNSGFRVFSKAGSLVKGYTSYTGFVNLPTGWAGFCYDPRIVYSNEYNKFLMMIMGKDNTNLKSYYWLMVSQTTDPNGAWWIWRFDSSAGATGSEEWLDYAAIGVDHWGVYVTGNYFDFPPGKRGGRTALWSWPPSYMSGTGGGGYRWDDLQWASGSQAFTVQPAFPHSRNSSGYTFYVNTYNGSGSKIQLWTQSGKRYPADTNPDSAGLARTEIDSKQYYWMGNNVDQPGSGWDIDGGDTRVMDATYSQGRVYATLCLNWDGNRAYSEVYIIALKTSDGTKDWDKAVFNANYNFFYPALTVEGGTSSPDVMLTFSQTEPGNASGFAGASWYYYNPTTKAGAWYVDRLGDGAYSRWDGDFEGDGRNRWGDYSGAEWDWSCNVAWGDAEYATSSNTWGTRISSRTLGSSDPCAYISVRNANGGEIYDAGDSVTINWDRLHLPATDTITVDLWTGTSWIVIAGGLSPSASSYSWTVNNIDTTAAKIFVGSWDSGGSAWTTSDMSDATFTIHGKPDLEWLTFNPPASGIQGVSYPVDTAVQNTGSVASGSFTVDLRLSSNSFCSASDDLIGSYWVSNLASGGTVSSAPTASIPASYSPGTAYLCMMIDSAHSTNDIDWSNNTTYQPITILSSEIFSDGFETGTMGQWSSTAP